MLPSYDICVRACTLSGDHEAHIMLLVERASRQDVVRIALARYPLTPREAEVAALVLRGYSNRRIADSLVLTEYTVEDHLKRIFSKVGVRSRSAMSSKILGIREEATG
jgi:DNA-binding NarL/FixJ family response regulator